MSTPAPIKTRYVNNGYFTAAARYNEPGGRQMFAGSETHQLLVSYGNKFPYSGALPFYQISTGIENNWQTCHIDLNNQFNQWTRGLACVQGTALGFAGITPPTFLTMMGIASPYGAVGWNRTRPTKAIASAGQAVGEVLKDGLPKLPGSQLASALRRLPIWASLARGGVRLGTPSTHHDVRRALGSEYLNWDFGWRPMISDAQSLIAASSAIRERIRRWRQAGNGVTTRRRTTLKDETTTNPVRFADNSIGNVYTLTSAGTWNGFKCDTFTRRDKIWYAAGYRLNMPGLASIEENPYVIASLIGAVPTPELAWELTPWSWLADWFTNVGDVLANLSDPLQHYYAATYACVMMTREESNTRVYTFADIGPTGPGYYSRIVNPSTVTVGARKWGRAQLRYPASPFGFGFTWDSLSNSQLATAAALGISRA